MRQIALDLLTQLLSSSQAFHPLTLPIFLCHKRTDIVFTAHPAYVALATSYSVKSGGVC